MKILVIDDNTSITNALDKYLRKQGFEVRVCNCGFEGIELIKNDTWDKILLDMSMPDYSGFDIIEYLETNNLLKDKHIILFSAAPIPEYVLGNLLKKDGIKSFLKKPVSLATVVNTITA